MPLHRSVDRFLAAAYLATGCWGCGGLPGSVVPSGAVPATAEAAAAWMAETHNDQAVLHQFRWKFREGTGGSAGGPGSARITPGDSLRFDAAGPLGTGRGSAFVIGEEAQWAEPEEDVRKLVPNYPLRWAMLGVARMPDPAGEVTRFEDGRLVAWRFVSGSDTVEYARIFGVEPRLIADVRQAGKRVGRVETTFKADGGLKSSRLDVPSVPARLDISYVSTRTATGFAPETWVRPAP